MHGGDFSPTKLISAIIKGEGYDSPRKMGALFWGLGFVFMVVNIILIVALNRYYPYFWIVAFPFMGAGFWMLVLGQPRATPDGSPAPMWGRIIVGLAFLLGLLGALGSVATTFL